MDIIKTISLVYIWLLIFTYYDLLGYKYILEGGKYKSKVIYYRIMQFAFQITLSLSMVLIDYRIAIYANILWYFLWEDFLYYIIGGYKLEPISWFVFSPLVFISMKIFKKPLPVWGLFLSLTIGIIVCILIKPLI